MTETTPTYHEDNAMVTAEQVGNQSAFRSLVDRPHRELQVHCFGVVAERTTFGADVFAFFGPPERL
jgi:hypothetical protein